MATAPRLEAPRAALRSSVPALAPRQPALFRRTARSVAAPAPVGAARGGVAGPLSAPAHPRGFARPRQSSRRAPAPARATESERGDGPTGAAILDRPSVSKVDRTAWSGPVLDQGFGGGDIGKILRTGGGGGGDDDDDDDEWTGSWDDDGEGDDGKGWFRAALGAVYDRETLRAVLEEWRRTLADVPAGLRAAAAAGACSSAALARYAALDARPSAARALARCAPEPVARGLVGRLMADPAFLDRVAYEGVVAGTLALASEAVFAAAAGARRRGEDRGRDRPAPPLLSLRASSLALFNALTAGALAALSAALVAPSAAAPPLAGKAARRPLLGPLPATALDRSLPGVRYTLLARAAAFARRAAQLAAAGAAVGVARRALERAARRADAGDEARRGPAAAAAAAPSAASPLAPSAVAADALVWGLLGAARLHAAVGVDEALADRAASLRGYLGASAALRGLGALGQEAARVRLLRSPELGATGGWRAADLVDDDEDEDRDAESSAAQAARRATARAVRRAVGAAAGAGAGAAAGRGRGKGRRGRGRKVAAAAGKARGTGKAVVFEAQIGQPTTK